MLRNLAIALSLGLAAVGLGAPAHASTYDYFLAGSIDGDAFGGSGAATVTGSSISGITFSVSNGAQSYSYADVAVDSTPGYIAAITTNVGAPAKWIVLTYGGPSVFSGSGGTAFYSVFSGSSLASITAAGSSAYVATVKISPVPLPGAVVLFGSAVVAVGAVTRFRRKKSVAA